MYKAGKTTDLPEYMERLKAYRMSQPWREKPEAEKASAPAVASAAAAGTDKEKKDEVVQASSATEKPEAPREEPEAPPEKPVPPRVEPVPEPLGYRLRGLRRPAAPQPLEQTGYHREGDDDRRRDPQLETDPHQGQGRHHSIHETVDGLPDDQREDLRVQLLGRAHADGRRVPRRAGARREDDRSAGLRHAGGGRRQSPAVHRGAGVRAHGRDGNGGLTEFTAETRRTQRCAEKT